MVVSKLKETLSNTLNPYSILRTAKALKITHKYQNKRTTIMVTKYHYNYLTIT